MRAFALALALCLLCGAHAEAQDGLVVADWGCDGALYRADVLRDLLALESAYVGAGDAPPAQVTLRSEDCDAERGTLTVEVARDSIVRRRVILLDAAHPESRARVAAIVIAELVLATRPRPEPPELASPALVAPPAVLRADSLSESSHRPRVEDAWRVQLAAALGGAYFPVVSTGMGSLRLGARLAAPPRWPWVFELSLRGASGIGAQSTSQTRIHHGSIQLGALALARGGPVELGGGLELDVGMAWVSGRDGSGDAHEWLDPIVVLSARAALTGRIAPSVALLVDVRVGWTLLGTELRAGDRALVGASGPMLALEVGALVDLL